MIKHLFAFLFVLGAATAASAQTYVAAVLRPSVALGWTF
jgi:hypothetical protein